MLFTAFLVSCDFLDIILDNDTSLEPDQFYAVDCTNNSFYKVRAKILAEGKYCVIWAENGSGVTETKAKEIAAKYDDVIRPKIVGAFGMKNITYKDGSVQYQFDDILDFANELAGRKNRKLTILLLDIKDGFKVKTDPYVAGYFYSGNFYPDGTQVNGNRISSNERDMIYVDTYPGLEMMPEPTYATFAHELQHLINFATTVLVERKNSNGSVSVMDTWIDEGLSSQAEQIYYEGTPLKDIFDGNIIEHLKRINNSETIAKGNNFFVWDNHPENKNAILDEYTTVYMFFRWLYLQAQAQAKGLQSNIFLNIETSNLSDYTVITNVAKDLNPDWNNWDKLLSSWLAANYYPTNSNYGYKDNYFKDIKVKPLTTTSTPLYPGEGVYSILNKSFTPPASVNIRYAGLSSGLSSIVTQGPFNSGVLLTYNINTNNSKSTASETGYLTGVTASVSSTPNPNSRTVIGDAQTETPTGPYRIDARDISSIFGRKK